VLLLGLTSMFTDVSSEMVTAVLPIYLLFQQQASVVQFGIIDGLYQGASALFRLVAGFLADRLDRQKEVAAAGYALDGFRLYGLDEPDGTPVTGLDEFNGHADGAGSYHYHSTRTYPYINGGLRGVIQVRDDQVDPQPAAAPVRPPLQPLRGAVITGFKAIAANAFSLEYRVNERLFTLNYGFSGSTYTFEFVDSSGSKRTETYRRR
jgi:hypothetical protein